jgi:hypothetical protein
MKARSTLVNVKSSFNGHVRNGQIVLDEPVALPEGAVVEVVPVEDDFGEMTDEERAELEAGIEEGIADFERGDFAPARELLQSLRNK